MEGSVKVERFDRAVMLLPYAMRERARELGRQEREECEEIRLRIGESLSFTFPDGERDRGGDKITRRDLDYAFELCTGASAYASRERISEGFVTAKGGYRVGLAGQYGEGGLMRLTGLDIRISREIRGCAEPFLREKPLSTLILSPPGGGKTTLLRDLIRLTGEKYRVSVCDERGELACLWEGAPTMDLGRRTDIIDGVPKARAAMMLIRSMNPQVIALDEITAPEDVSAVSAAAHCGVKVYATVHADSLEELGEKPLYRALFNERIFERAIIIGNGRKYTEAAIV